MFYFWNWKSQYHIYMRYFETFKCREVCGMGWWKRCIGCIPRLCTCCWPSAFILAAEGAKAASKSSPKGHTHCWVFTLEDVGQWVICASSWFFPAKVSFPTGTKQLGAEPELSGAFQRCRAQGEGVAPPHSPQRAPVQAPRLPLSRS